LTKEGRFIASFPSKKLRLFPGIDRKSRRNRIGVSVSACAHGFLA
jgi:hypothetical protein